jgi:hypothetical protein
MRGTVSLLTWDEYLTQATLHLAALRRAAEVGLPAPAALERPQGPMPDDRREAAARLAVGYDQLAVEVTTRMSSIEQRRSSLSDRNPHREQRPAHFIDTPA